MATSSKKKNRKLRRQVRKTLGALFMASAVAVAAIPVQDVSALDYPVQTETNKKIKVLNYTSASNKAGAVHEKLSDYTKGNIQYAVENWGSEVEEYLQSTVPYVDPSSNIYTTSDGMFQFAFVKPSTDEADEVAVILGANVNQLPNNYLEIPDSVDAYRKYTATSTSSGYCAVNREGEFLYYKTRGQKFDSNSYPLYTVPEFNNGKGPNNETSGDLGYYEWPENRLTAKRDDDGNITGYVFIYSYKTEPTPVPESSPEEIPPSETVSVE